MCHIHGQQTLKTHPQTCFPVDSNCLRPSHITRPLSLSHLHSRVQPASAPIAMASPLLPELICWVWWQNSASLHLTFSVPWDVAACVHVRYHVRCICASVTLGWCTSEPDLTLPQTWLVPRLDPPSLHVTVLTFSVRGEHISCENDTTITPATGMQWSCF